MIVPFFDWVMSILPALLCVFPIGFVFGGLPRICAPFGENRKAGLNGRTETQPKCCCESICPMQRVRELQGRVMSEQSLEEIRRELASIRVLLAESKASPRSSGEAAAHEQGLLSYEDLQDALTIGRKNPHRPCLRTVKALVEKNKRIIRRVPLGHSLVGFRPADVQRLVAHLAGDTPPGGLKL